VVEENEAITDRLRKEGIEVYAGTAAQPDLLEAVNLPGARWLISAIPSPFEGGDLIERARAANPALRIIARAHGDAEVEHLKKFGANHIVLGEIEIAREMVNRLFSGDGGASAGKAGA
jgi:CPA2 family monovalent cation:H+ antiporter-2